MSWEVPPKPSTLNPETVQPHSPAPSTSNPNPTIRHYHESSRVRIPGRMSGACLLHASIPVFPCHAQPLQGAHVTKHRYSPLSHLPIFHPERSLVYSCFGGVLYRGRGVYRGTSLIRNTQPPIITKGRYPCYTCRWCITRSVERSFGEYRQPLTSPLCPGSSPLTSLIPIQPS